MSALSVYLKGVRIGRLEETSDGLLFAYLAEYLASNDASVGKKL